MRENVFSVKKVLLLIFLLAFALRLLGLSNIELRGDFAYHWQVAGTIIESGRFIPVGPGASINQNIFLGPFYYYLLSVPYLIGAGDYRVAVVFFSLLNSLAVFPLYYICSKWLDEKKALGVILLYSISSYLIQVQNFPWNAFEIPLLVILSLYFLVRIGEGKYFFTPFLFLALSLGIQMHATFLFLVPLFLFSIPFKKIPGRLIFSSVVVFLIPFSTWFVFEIEHNFLQLRESLRVFLPDPIECVFSDWLANHGNGERCFHFIRNPFFVFRLFSQSLFSTRNNFVAIIAFSTAIFALIKSKITKRTFFMSWLFSVFALFMLYSRNIYPHYFLILIPLPFISFVMFLDLIGKNGKWGRLTSKIIFFLVISYNIIDYLYSLAMPRG